jgi:hypothetical protein
MWPGKAVRAKLLEEEGKKSCHSFSGSAISSSMQARGVDDATKTLSIFTALL